MMLIWELGHYFTYGAIASVLVMVLFRLCGVGWSGTLLRPRSGHQHNKGESSAAMLYTHCHVFSVEVGQFQRKATQQGQLIRGSVFSHLENQTCFLAASVKSASKTAKCCSSILSVFSRLDPLASRSSLTRALKGGWFCPTYFFRMSQKRRRAAPPFCTCSQFNSTSCVLNFDPLGSKVRSPGQVKVGTSPRHRCQSSRSRCEDSFGPNGLKLSGYDTGMDAYKTYLSDSSFSWSQVRSFFYLLPL